MIGPASLIQRSVGTGDVDGTCGIGEKTGAVVDEGFSSVHGPVSGVVNRFADAASECIVLILHRFCNDVCRCFERDRGELVGVVPGVFGFRSGGDVGFAGLVAFEVIRSSQCSCFGFLPCHTFCRSRLLLNRLSMARFRCSRTPDG